MYIDARNVRSFARTQLIQQKFTIQKFVAADQLVAVARRPRDLNAFFAQPLNLVPHGRSGHTQPIGQFPARIRTAVSQDSQDIKRASHK